MRARPFFVSLTLVLGACDSPPIAAVESDAGPGDAGPQGLAILGAGTHDPASLEIVEIANRDDGLSGPRDLGLSPIAADELWVLNSDSAMVIVSSAGAADRAAIRRRRAGYQHFMHSPAAMAFGDSTMATAHETDEITQSSTPADFMGPSLWPIDPAVFDAGHASHLDMLHNSPNAVGIAWDSGNAYWVFDGYHRSITFYDFRADHGPAGEDHSDGIIHRWVEGQVGHVEGVSSHMELDRATGILYIADTGNTRIATLDTRSGTPAGELSSPNYDGVAMRAIDSPPLATLVEGASAGLVQPSGLALRNGTLFVSDRATARIHAFDLEGRALDFLDLTTVIAPGSLGAIELDASGRIYVTDLVEHRVVRIAARAR